MHHEDTPLTLAEYRELKARADASRMSVLAVARKVGAECGLGSEMPFHMAANAMVGAHYGRPWSGIDYSGVRRIVALERRMGAANIIVDRLVSRRGIAFREVA